MGLGALLFGLFLLHHFAVKLDSGGLCHVEIGGGGTCKRRGWTEKVGLRKGRWLVSLDR